jgi:hypothetical protein
MQRIMICIGVDVEDTKYYDCGNIKNRSEVLGLLSDLAIIDIADHKEVLEFIQIHQLMGRGIGYVDVHLLAAV